MTILNRAREQAAFGLFQQPAGCRYRLKMSSIWKLDAGEAKPGVIAPASQAS